MDDAYTIVICPAKNRTQPWTGYDLDKKLWPNIYYFVQKVQYLQDDTYKITQLVVLYVEPTYTTTGNTTQEI